MANQDERDYAEEAFNRALLFDEADGLVTIDSAEHSATLRQMERDKRTIEALADALRAYVERDEEAIDYGEPIGGWSMRLFKPGLRALSLVKTERPRF